MGRNPTIFLHLKILLPFQVGICLSICLFAVTEQMVYAVTDTAYGWRKVNSSMYKPISSSRRAVAGQNPALAVVFFSLFNFVFVSCGAIDM